MGETVKACRWCGDTKPVSLFPARGARCKKCVADYNRAYYKANRESIRTTQGEYRKGYYEANKGRLREQYRLYREANRDDILAKKRAFYVANRATLLAQSRKYNAARGDLHRDNVRKWRAANPGKPGEYNRAYRARKLNAQGAHTDEDWNRMLRIWNWSCAYCGNAGEMTRDHVIPLSRGGSDFIGNIVPACARCNSSKNARVVVEWMATR